MQRSLRKGDGHVHVTYRDGEYSNHLIGSGFELEADEQDITLSIDMSGNQRTRNKDSDSYHDVIQLQEDAESIDFIQINKESWLSPPARAMREYGSAVWQLELRFFGDKVHTMPFRLEAEGTTSHS